MRFASLVVIVAVLSPTLQAQAPAHPLDGLTAREHWVVYDALFASGRTDSTTRFLYEALHEPPKADVLAWRPGQPFRREAFVHMSQGGKGYEAVVDINAARVLSWREIPGRQYMVSAQDGDAVHEVMIKDTRVRDAIRRRGVTDFTHVRCGQWNEGFFDRPEERGRRVVRATCWSDRGRVSGYGASFEGLVAVVDITDKRIISVSDSGARPFTGPFGDHDSEAIGTPREIRTPISMHQPMGPSFDVNRHEVSWQNWNFHFRLDMRRGVVLSMLRYNDGGRDRPVMYQGSLSELFVPYMDASPLWDYTSYFDLGSYVPWGLVGNSLEPGSDCPSNATYFNAVFVTSNGAPVERVRAMCLFERYAGDVSWRHSREGGTVESRPRRDLVLRMYMTAGNYDYLFDWVFRQDGSFGMNIGSTGMDQVKVAQARDANGGGASAGGSDDEAYGRFIAPFLVGVNHSHFFSFRLDLDVDGPANSLAVDRLVTQRLPETSARRSLWKVESSVVRSEQEGMRHSTMDKPEIWRVINPSIKGPYGMPVGYEIGGFHGSLTLMSQDDYTLRRAGFTKHMLWVTPHKADELFAAGDYPTVGPADEGLPKWTAANRGIVGTDIVVWPTLGFHHVPRPEDFPIMPVVWHSFDLRPVGFFSRNPAIDLPKGGR